MEYNSVSFEKRVKENIKNYALDNLYDIGALTDYLKAVATVIDGELLLTDRHGEKLVSIGDFVGFTPDVVNFPGRKIRVANRTVAHLYICLAKEPAEEVLRCMEKLLDNVVVMLSKLGEESYLHNETAIYVAELEEKLDSKHQNQIHGVKEDALTGVYHKVYFEERMKVVDRAQVAPVAVINMNINDWKYVNDNYGEEESDRLIKTIAGIIKKEAKPDYVIGRVDGDVFIVLIPMVEQGEAEEYCDRVQAACLAYEDEVIAPSVACGIVFKTNVEEQLMDKLPDAEYEMFNHKLEIKNAPGYRERLEKRK